MDFSKLTAYLDTLEPDYRIPAFDCTVHLHGEEIYRHSHRWQPGSLFWIYSLTKLFLVTAVWQLIEQDRLSLDDEVGKYLPEWAEMTVQTESGVVPCRTPITVGHLLSMRGGLDYDVETPFYFDFLAANPNADTQAVLRHLSKKTLNFEPGTRYRYSMCHDLLGAVLEVVTGMTLGAYLTQYVALPLGCRDVTFHPDSDQRARLQPKYRHYPDSDQIIREDACEFYFSPCYDSGGAGIVSSTDDVALLLDALACGGKTKSGAQLLSPETIDRLRTPQLTGAALEDFHRTSRGSRVAGYNYGYGVRVQTGGGNSRSSVGEFGWNGRCGSYALIDPATGETVMFSEHVCRYTPNYDVIHPTIRDLVFELLSR